MEQQFKDVTHQSNFQFCDQFRGSQDVLTSAISTNGHLFSTHDHTKGHAIQRDSPFAHSDDVRKNLGAIKTRIQKEFSLDVILSNIRNFILT
jgi:hypothetical protein